jgi:RND superfamily putative drug exporter
MLTLCYTIAMSFGISSALFCQQWSHPTLFPGIPDLDSIMWLIPVLVTPLLLALAIDYDFFLLVRIVELRELKRRELFGVSSTRKESSCSWLTARRSLPLAVEAHIVGAAVQRTGSVITYAAFMMFFAFGGLLLSGTLMLRQFGCFVVVAVIVDAFIVRPLLVPALMGLWPSALWWPRQ